MFLSGVCIIIWLYDPCWLWQTLEWILCSPTGSGSVCSTPRLNCSGVTWPIWFYWAVLEEEWRHPSCPFYLPISLCPVLIHLYPTHPPSGEQRGIGQSWGLSRFGTGNNKYSKWVRGLFCSVLIVYKNDYFMMYRRNRECVWTWHCLVLLWACCACLREKKWRTAKKQTTGSRFLNGSFKGTQPQDPAPFKEPWIASPMNRDRVCARSLCAKLCRVTPEAAVWRRHFTAPQCAPRGWTAPTDGALTTSRDWRRCYNVGIRRVGECLLFFLLLPPPLPAVRNCREVAGKIREALILRRLQRLLSYALHFMWNTCEWNPIRGGEWQEELSRSSPCGFPKK